jgi:predicted methyltransferase
MATILAKAPNAYKKTVSMCVLDRCLGFGFIAESLYHKSAHVLQLSK